MTCPVRRGVGRSLSLGAGAPGVRRRLVCRVVLVRSLDAGVKATARGERRSVVVRCTGVAGVWAPRAALGACACALLGTHRTSGRLAPEARAMATRPQWLGGDGGRNCPIPELRRSRPWDSAGEAFPPQGATRCVRIRRGSLERRLCIEPYEDALGCSAALALDDGGPPSDDRRARAQRAATTDSQVPGHHPRSLILPTPPALGPNRRNRGRRRARREPLRLVPS